MNPASLLLGLFDWRGTLARAPYRRNVAILVLVDLICRRLDLFSDDALIVWTAVLWAISLAFFAKRYHDMGRSAAWIVWANLISAAVALVAFQFFPNALNFISLPGWLHLGGQADWIIGRLVLPALVGAAVGSLAQSLWLAWGASYVGPNPYAAPTGPQRSPALRQDASDGDAAAEAIIERHLAARQSEPAPAAPAPSPRPTQVRSAPSPGGQRVFGKR
jgi:multidrug transporter EmrE-like cation transporter